MEPQPPGTGPEAMGQLRLDLLRAAVETYLKTAYPSGEIPEVVQRRLIWPEGLAAEEMLTKPPFERAGKVPGHQSANLCPAARQFPLSAHEAADPALAQRGRLHALGQHPRSGGRPRPGRRGRCRPFDLPGREPASQRGDRAGLG